MADDVSISLSRGSFDTLRIYVKEAEKNDICASPQLTAEEVSLLTVFIQIDAIFVEVTRLIDLDYSRYAGLQDAILNEGFDVAKDKILREGESGLESDLLSPDARTIINRQGGASLEEKVHGALSDPLTLSDHDLALLNIFVNIDNIFTEVTKLVEFDYAKYSGLQRAILSEGFDVGKDKILKMEEPKPKSDCLQGSIPDLLARLAADDSLEEAAAELLGINSNRPFYCAPPLPKPTLTSPILPNKLEAGGGPVDVILNGENLDQVYKIQLTNRPPTTAYKTYNAGEFEVSPDGRQITIRRVQLRPDMNPDDANCIDGVNANDSSKTNASCKYVWVLYRRDDDKAFPFYVGVIAAERGEEEAFSDSIPQWVREAKKAGSGVTLQGGAGGMVAGSTPDNNINRSNLEVPEYGLRAKLAYPLFDQATGGWLTITPEGHYSGQAYYGEGTSQQNYGGGVTFLLAAKEYWNTRLQITVTLDQFDNDWAYPNLYRPYEDSFVADYRVSLASTPLDGPFTLRPFYGYQDDNFSAEKFRDYSGERNSNEVGTDVTYMFPGGDVTVTGSTVWGTREVADSQDPYWERNFRGYHGGLDVNFYNSTFSGLQGTLNQLTDGTRHIWHGFGTLEFFERLAVTGGYSNGFLLNPLDIATHYPRMHDYRYAIPGPDKNDTYLGQVSWQLPWPWLRGLNIRSLYEYHQFAKDAHEVMGVAEFNLVEQFVPEED